MVSRRLRIKAYDFGMGWEEIGVHGPGECGEALEEIGSGRVEEVVRDADDVTGSDRGEALPLAACDDLGKGDAVADTAPGKDEEVGVRGGDNIGRCVGAGGAEEAAAGSVDELCDPGLGLDEGLAPLLAIDEGFRRGSSGEGAGLAEGGLKLPDDGLRCLRGVGDGAEEADVGKDGSEVMRGERKGGEAGLEDCRKGLDLVGQASDDEVGAGGEKGVEGGGPGVKAPGVLEQG